MSKTWWLPIITIASLAACGNSSSGPSADQACTALAQARCSKRMTCTGGTGITRLWGDMATCLTREKLACTLGLAAPSTGNSPAEVEKCVAAFPTYSCADFLDNNPPADCQVTGPLAANAVCAFAGQCASDFCSNNKNSQCGTCGPLPAAGASCLSSGCGHGQECVASTTTCQTLGAASASCDPTTSPCGADLVCSGTAAAKTCMTPVSAVGMPCGGTMPGCDGTMGLYCGGAVGSKTCMNINYVASGMPCGTLADGSFVGCAGGGGCYTATGIAAPGAMGTCKAPAADNAACDITVGPPCQTPARCIVTGAATAGTCTIPTGATCH